MQLETAKLSTRLAQMSLDAENKRLESGLGQNYLVLQAQDALAQAQTSELSTMIAYRKAIINLQRSMFVLLEASEIDIATDISTSKSLGQK